MAKPIRKYVLKSEIERSRSKHPDFLIAVDAVTVKNDADEDVHLEAKNISCPPSERFSDEVIQLSNTNPVAAARLLIGDENYRHFAAAGGSATLLFQMAADNGGAEPGESPASDAS